MSRKRTKTKKPLKNVKKAEKKNTTEVLKQIERSVLSLRLYPVAVKEDAKEKALENIKRIYKKNSDSVRQHILLLMHEHIAKASELRALNTYDLYKAKSPKASPGAIRMKVYKDMFNYTTSAEGLVDFVLLVGELGGDDAAKLLTHLFSHFCSSENEINHMMRNAVIDALGKSDSPYALKSLLKYASISDNDKILARLSSALVDWDDKIESLKLDAKEKEGLKKELREILTREDLTSRQYG